jgi:hypothetical protein
MALSDGDKGIDFAGAALSAGEIAAAGIKYVFRYSAGAGNDRPDTQFKLCKPGEIAALTAAGVDFIANSEWYETRCTEGAQAGHDDGVADLAFWKSRGLAQGKSIYVSWDAAPDPALYNAVAEYLSAYTSALEGYYVGNGLYAGIPALVALSQRGSAKHGWIPEGASWSVQKVNLDTLGISAPPAVTTWDLWEPTPSQVAPAVAYLKQQLTGHQLTSCVWQDLNHMFSDGADENIILFGADALGSQLQGGVAPANGPTPVPIPAPQPDPVPVSVTGLPPYRVSPGEDYVSIAHKYPQPWITPATLQALNPWAPNAIPIGAWMQIGPKNPPAPPPRPWPAYMAPGNYFGLITGPAQSHGGYYPNEKPDVQAIQQKLQQLGYAPNVPAWADGIFQQPTVNAVAAFQRAHMPGTQFFGQVWSDDWAKLFSL